jgi:hypothetical protein
VSLALALDAVDRVSLRDGRLALLAVVLGLGVLTRTDFVIVAAVVAAWIGVGRRGRRHWAAAGVLIATTAVVLGAHTVFRYAYYGDALPNTYYLKMTGLGLGARLGRGLRTSLDAVAIGFASALVVVAVACARRSTGGLRRGVALLVAVTGVLLAYSTWVGGDAWEYYQFANRYLVPGLVTLLIAVVVSADRIVADWRASALSSRVVATAAMAVAVVAYLGPFPPAAIGFHRALGGVDRHVGADRVVVAVALLIATVCAALVLALRREERGAAATVLAVLVLTPLLGLALVPDQLWFLDANSNARPAATQTEYGVLLRSLTKPDARIAVYRAGAPPYYAQRPTVDLLGKSDAYVAHLAARSSFPGHNKYSYRYSIGRLRPEVVAEFWGSGARLTRWGYVPVLMRHGDTLLGFWALDGSPAIRWNRLQRTGAIIGRPE